MAEEEPKRRSFSLPERMEWYKPLKKAVTLRGDADVLAGSESGRGYQTRINGALRKLMKEEMKEDESLVDRIQKPTMTGSGSRRMPQIYSTRC